MVKRFISHRGQSPSGKYYINTEAEGRGFNESLPHFRAGKPNSTTTKCVTNVIYFLKCEKVLFHTLKSDIEVVEFLKN